MVRGNINPDCYRPKTLATPGLGKHWVGEQPVTKISNPVRYKIKGDSQNGGLQPTMEGPSGNATI